MISLKLKRLLETNGIGPIPSIMQTEQHFDNMADFIAAGGAEVNPGPVWVGGKQYNSDGEKYIESEEGTVITEAVGDVAPVYDISLIELAGSVVRNGAPMTVGGSRAVNMDAGTRLEWDAGLTLADGNYIAVSYVFGTPVDISALDRLMFEFSHDNNWYDTRLQIIVSSANNLTNASRFIYISNTKLPSEALMLLKSDFATWTGTGVNWGTLARIDFRFTKHTADNAGQRARVDLHRVTIGQKTRPLVLFTQDDNAIELYEAFKRNESLGIVADMFVTDYEIATEDNFSRTAKCSLAQNKEMEAAGYRFYVHNIDHRAYSQAITAISRIGNIVTITISGYGSNSSSAADMLPVAGEFIAIDWHRSEQLNGVWMVDSITPGTTTTNTTIVITVPGAAFPNDSTGYGGTVTALKYDVVSDIKRLRSMIKRAGLRTSDRYLSYTYGRNSLTIHKQLLEIGVTLARATANAPHSFPEVNAQGIMQIDRNFGRGGQSARFLSLITSVLTTAANLQTSLDRLLLTGGVLSIYTHGDDISEANLDACMSLLAQYRDAGDLDIVQLHQLEAEINARR